MTTDIEGEPLSTSAVGQCQEEEDVDSEDVSTMNQQLCKSGADLLHQLSGFNLDDKELLRSCWHHLAKQKEDVAMDVFILIFKQCPETKKLFYFVDTDQPATSSKRMKDDNAFQFHALRFVQILESMIDNLDDPISVEPVLHGLGQIHLRFRDKFGFQTYYWSVFSECTLFVFRERLKHRIDDIDRAVTLWRVVLGAIKQKMKQGFYDGDRKRKNLRSNNVSQTSASPSAYSLLSASGISQPETSRRRAEDQARKWSSSHGHETKDSTSRT